MSCPVCRGEDDVRRALLESLCPDHFGEAEASSPSEDEMLVALEQSPDEQYGYPVLHPWPHAGDPRWGSAP